MVADTDARRFATDPAHNVVLEASAGTGKTSVLVARYLNLLRANVGPANILAITFTRKAAAEMRVRIIAELRRESRQSDEGLARWNGLRDHLNEVSISTVDAFCFSLLREFPLEADLDPGFSVADETEVRRLQIEAIDRALVVAGRLANKDETIAMLLACLGPTFARQAFGDLLEQRLIVPDILHKFLAGTPRGLDGVQACCKAVDRFREMFESFELQLEQIDLETLSKDPRALAVISALNEIPLTKNCDVPRIRAWLDRMRDLFLTKENGRPRKQFVLNKEAPKDLKRQYRDFASAVALEVKSVLDVFDRDVNVVMVRGVQRVFRIVLEEYEEALSSRALLDFTGLLEKSVRLLEQMDEFSRSRYRLESRYHHVLVDEFQDTSRMQWKLISLLVQSWSEGSGLTDDIPVPPTIFIVGDRKQSIYKFRNADLSIFRDASKKIENLRNQDRVHSVISESFRSVPTLLNFINDFFDDIGNESNDKHSFSFKEQDRFPVRTSLEVEENATALGLVIADSVEKCANSVADEIVDLLSAGQVKNKDGGYRSIRKTDIAILFRSRASHREFERALESRSVPTYVYKGLGFFDAKEIKDIRALIRFLANPSSELRAAAFLRSRFVNFSDTGLSVLSRQLSKSLTGPDPLTEFQRLSISDKAMLTKSRQGLARWLKLVDRLPPSEVLERVLRETAFAYELRGPHSAQAIANVGRMRSLIRRIQNRGYATMGRLSEHIDQLSSEMSNAVVESIDAVNLMTIHAAKGLEFPVVFLVDLGRGVTSQSSRIRVVADQGGGEPSVTVAPFRAEADRIERRRESEETKRLLYVAVTRACDRLYFSTVLKKEKPVFKNKTSLGSAFPESFSKIFLDESIRSEAKFVEWKGPSGEMHRFRICYSGC